VVFSVVLDLSQRPRVCLLLRQNGLLVAQDGLLVAQDGGERPSVCANIGVDLIQPRIYVCLDDGDGVANLHCDHLPLLKHGLGAPDLVELCELVLEPSLSAVGRVPPQDVAVARER